MGGKIVKEFKNELLSVGKNTIFWDGINDNKQLVIPGPYIIYAEVYNQYGEIKRTKKMLVVAIEY